MIGARWRPPLRIAARTARRYPGRTVLVGALIGLPVLAGIFVDTVLRTVNLSATEQATRRFGAADAELTVTRHGLLSVSPGGSAISDDRPERDPASVDLPSLLPAGSRLVPYPGNRSIRFDGADRVVLANGKDLRTDDPLTAGIVGLRSGRLPARAGEVALSPGLAARLGVGVGGEVHPQGGPAARVVGIAVDQDCRSCQLAVGLPGWAGPADGDAKYTYLLDLPGGAVADNALVQRLAGHGVYAESRDLVLHPERWGASGPTDAAATLGVAVVIVGVGLIEVVLLAGTAFAVTARRQVREAALVLANGGRPADVRRMVLAHGGVLGLLGSAAGAGLGVGLVLAGWPFWQRLANKDFAGLVVVPLDLGVVVGAGVLTSLVAALLPARGAARLPVLAALAGRYGRPARHRHRVVAAGLVTAALGLTGAILAVGGWRTAAMPQPGNGPPPDTLPYGLAAVAGFTALVAGLAVCTPALVGLAGRLARRLPLTARLAVRDAARHRYRTGPAVAAVMVSVCGSVAVAMVTASYDGHDRAMYQPTLPTGYVAVDGYGGNEPGAPDVTVAARAAAAELPATDVVPIRVATLRNGDNVFPGTDIGCQSTIRFGVTVGAALAAVAAGPHAAEARAALVAGRAAAFAPCLVHDGKLRLQVGDTLLGTVPAVEIATPAYVGLPPVVLDERTAARLGLVTQTYSVLIPTSRPPTQAEEDRARAALGDTRLGLTIEQGYGSPYLSGLVALAGGAGLITLAGVAISVSLSAAEGRADLATLAAVGAAPRRRRALAGWQATLVAGLGVTLGIAVGGTMGGLLLHAMPGYPFVLPWQTLLALGVGVPLLGVLVVVLTTRSRLPMVRRVG